MSGTALAAGRTRAVERYEACEERNARVVSLLSPKPMSNAIIPASRAISAIGLRERGPGAEM